MEMAGRREHWWRRGASWSARALSLGLAVTAAACANIGAAGLFATDPDARVDAALAAVVRGQYDVAGPAVADALRVAPNDPYALLAAGALFRNTGHPEVARDLYQRLLALNPVATVNVNPWDKARRRPMADVARGGLLDLGAVTHAADDHQVANASAGHAPPHQGEDHGEHVAHRQALAPAADSQPEPAAKRLAILNTLAAQGLISGGERARRRAANIGALLPLTHEPAGVGMERPPADGERIIERLNALRNAFEAGAITARQHAEERTLILNGLVPEHPSPRAAAKPVPSNIVEAAAALEHVERFQRAGLVTAAEARKEREALERGLRQSPGSRKAAPRKQASAHQRRVGSPRMLRPQKMNTVAHTHTGGTVAVHLASFRSREKALSGWAELRSREPSLSKLRPMVTTVTLPGQGLFYRLNAGPLNDRVSAEGLCLGLGDQFCEVSYLGG